MLHIYFNIESLIAAGATMVTQMVGPPNDKRSEEKLQFGSHLLHLDPKQGCPYMLDGGALPCQDVPESLKAFVLKVSYRERLAGRVYRKLGCYSLKSATAELSMGGDCQHVDITAQSLYDAKELYLLISEGKIWPSHDYSQDQVPPPARHLRQLIREAWALIRREVSDRLYGIKQRVSHKS